jgi:sortase A
MRVPVEAVCDDMQAVSRIDALSEVVFGSRAPRHEQSATEVAAEASDAARHAARAAIVAADAAIAAATAAVRLIDEHEGKTIVLAPHAHRALPGGEGSKVIHLPPASELAVRPVPSVGSRSPRSRSLRALAVGLIVVGALLLADAVVTLVWQEPISALYTSLRQDSLSSALRREEKERPTRAEQQALTQLGVQQARIAYLASALQHHARQGSPVARIRIPRIGASFVVVNGTSESALQSGPGIFPNTAFPGGGATTAIAGHRTTYLAPFRHIDALHPGDRIELEMPYANFTYVVTGSRVVAPTDVRDAVANVGYPRLVLSACTPLFSAAKRLLVFARLTATAAKGTGVPPSAVASRRA